MIHPLSRLALILVLTLGAASAQTFVPADGAAPWSDRADWSLSGVPESAKGAGPVAQQSCTSRSALLPGSPTAAVIGVYEKDAPAFEALGLQATKTGETFSVKNAAGLALPYVVYRVAAPPAKIGGTFTAGLVLLKVEGGAAPAPSAPAPPAAPTPAAPAPSPVAAAPASGDKTYVVADGAAPWYDRADWMLSGVPASVKGITAAQQSCTSRSVVVPAGAKAVLIGVCEKDLPAFDALGFQATKTGDTFVIKNAAGISLSYLVYRIAAPPAKIGGALTAGLVLLKVEADGAAPSPAAAAAPAGRSPFEIADAKKFHIYLLIGQSNMVGRDVTGIGEQVPDPRVGSLDATGKWVVAVEPLYTGGSGFGPGTFFAASILASGGSGQIGLVPCAVGGTPLSRWVKGGDLYEAAVKRAKQAQGAGVLEGVLWHQGESDSLDAGLAESYETRLTQMFQDLRADLGNPNLPIVVGQLGTFVQAPCIDIVRAALQDVARTVPNVGFADSDGLGDKGDHLHFSTASQQAMGTRYAAAMRQLLQRQASAPSKSS